MLLEEALPSMSEAQREERLYLHGVYCAMADLAVIPLTELMPYVVKEALRPREEWNAFFRGYMDATAEAAEWHSAEAERDIAAQREALLAEEA